MLDVNKIRDNFPILNRKIGDKPLVYLDSAATSQKPRRVIDKIVDFYENHNANIHRGVHSLSVEATEMVDQARLLVSKLIGAETSETVFVRNASEGINLVAYAWGRKFLKKGDVIVISIMEHHSNLVPWQILRDDLGVELRVVAVDAEGCLDMVDLGKKLDQKVKLVALTAVSNVLGSITDLVEVRKMVRAHSPLAKILIDGCQLVPHMEVNVRDLGIDFLAFSGHKMLGPTGVGVLWGKREILEEMNPFLYGGDMISEVTLAKTSFAGLPSKFEAGTPDIAGIIGLGEAVSYLTELGLKNVREHEKSLIAYGLERMQVLEKKNLVEIYGSRNAEKRGGVLTFNVKGVHAHDVAQVLDRYGIAVRSGQHCGAPIVTSFGVPAMVRASFYVYTSKEEIDFLMEMIEEVPGVFKI